MPSTPDPTDWDYLDPERAADVPDYDRATHPLAHLPPRERLAVTLSILGALPYREDGGFSDRDLAEIAGVSHPTVAALRQDALAKLSLHRDAFAPYLRRRAESTP